MFIFYIYLYWGPIFGSCLSIFWTVGLKWIEFLDGRYILRSRPTACAIRLHQAPCFPRPNSPSSHLLLALSATSGDVTHDELDFAVRQASELRKNKSVQGYPSAFTHGLDQANREPDSSVLQLRAAASLDLLFYLRRC